MGSFFTELLNILLAIAIVVVSLGVVLALLMLVAKIINQRRSVKKSRQSASRAPAAKPHPKRVAIHRYIQQLGPHLRQRYGRQKTYTTSQVKQTIAASGYGSDYDCYALALFCAQDDFINYHQTIGESCDYQAMRGEVTDFFGALAPSDPAFDACDVLDLSEQLSPIEATSSNDAWESSFSDSGNGHSDYGGYSDSSYSGSSDYSGSSYSGGSSDSSYSGGSSDSGSS